MRYWPVPSDTALRTFSINAGLDTSTVTPGSTAPDPSVTTPAIVACCADAAVGRATPRANVANRRSSTRRMRVNLDSEGRRRVPRGRHTIASAVARSQYQIDGRRRARPMTSARLAIEECGNRLGDGRRILHQHRVRDVGHDARLDRRDPHAELLERAAMAAAAGDVDD